MVVVRSACLLKQKERNKTKQKAEATSTSWLITRGEACSRTDGTTNDARSVNKRSFLIGSNHDAAETAVPMMHQTEEEREC
jgi:hypothetical protein